MALPFLLGKVSNTITLSFYTAVKEYNTKNNLALKVISDNAKSVYQGEYVASENNLGIILIRMQKNEESLQNDVYEFRVKEKGSKDWLAQNTYKTLQFINEEYFAFGIPLRENSKGKTYQFEFVSLDADNKGLSLSTTEPKMGVAYFYSTQQFRTDPNTFKDFFVNKLTFAFSNISFIIPLASSIVVILIIFTILFVKKINHKKFIINRRWLLICIFILYLVSLKLTYIGIPLVLILLTLFLPNTWSFVRRSIFAVLAFLLCNILVAYLFFVGHVPLDPRFIISFYIIVASILLLTFKKNFIVAGIVTKDDIVALLTPAFIIIFFILGVTHYPNNFVLPIVTEGDSAAHFTMSKLAFEKQSLLYGSYYYQGTPWSVEVAYPPGFYSNTAIFGQLLFHDVDISKLDAYFINMFYIINYIVVALIIYIAGMIILAIADIERKSLSSFVIVPFLFFLLFGYLLLYQFVSGFSAQLTAILFFLTFIYSLIYFENKISTLAFCVLLILNFIVSASWFVILPVTMALCLYVLVKNYNKRNLQLALVAFPLSVIPLYFDVKRILDSKVFTDMFTITSGVGGVDYNLIVILMVIAVASFFIFNRKQNNISFYLAIVISAVYSLAILLLQIYMSGKPGYFYYKSLHFLFILLAIISCTTVIKIISYASRYLENRRSTLLAFFIGVIIMYFFYHNYSAVHINNYLQGNLKIALTEQALLLRVSGDKKYVGYEIIPYSSNFLIYLWSQGFFPHNVTRFYSNLPAWNKAVSADRVTAAAEIRHYVERREDRQPVLVLDLSCYAKTWNTTDLLDLEKQNRILIYPQKCPKKM